MEIILTNHRCRLVAPAKLLIKVRKHPLFAVKAKGYFFSTAYRRGNWDGYIRFIDESGRFHVGKLFHLIKVLNELKETDYEFIDERQNYMKPKALPLALGGNKLLDYQLEALKAIGNNKIPGTSILFPRCVLSMATNAGKTYISAGIYKMYKEPTLFLLNSKELLEQSLRDIPKLIPGKVGYLASSMGEEWNDFMIVMVQTAKARINSIGNKLAKFKVVIVDECDLAGSRSYTSVLSYCFNAFVKVGLSGSVYADPRKKDKNEKLREQFGNIAYTITNKQLIDNQKSSKVKVFFWNGNTKIKDKDYNEEYLRGIIDSKERNFKIVKRAETHVKKDRLPLLIICQKHRHILNVYNSIIKKADILGHEFFGLKIDWVHHKRQNRKEVVELFEQGKIDILVGSYILKRGKNFPLMRWLINAAGGDSIANVLQILGRATRKHESKEYTGIDDFYDKGFHIRKHSLHRLQTYKREQVEVIDRVDYYLLK